MQGAGDARLDQLLMERATQGLDRPAEAELRELQSRFPDRDLGAFEHAAAAIHLALLDEEPLPAGLRPRLEEAARQLSRREGGFGESRQVAEETLAPARPAGGEISRFPAAAAARSRPGYRAGWLAAAAGLALAVVGWWPRLAPAPAPSPGQSRAELVGEASDLVRLAWSATDDPAAAGAGGDVVWSGERQTGFMRIRGLGSNDPAAAQYQLWIFDRGRDERYPVDGGVFDVPAGASEVIVPIEAGVEVGEPYLFAVTVEQPGGVVVSSRERIVLLAQA